MKYIVAESEQVFEVSSPEAVMKAIQEIYTEEQLMFQEIFWVIPLQHGKMFEAVELFKGGTDCCPVFLPTLFRAVLLTPGADSFIVAHNHPSGDTTPSREDIKLTKDVKKAAEIMKLGLTDHIIVTPKGDYVSLAERGELY